MASASNGSEIDRIELYLDGGFKPAREKDSLTWKRTVRKVSSGEHTILVKAFNEAGNTSTDSIVVYK
jgi:hypothetical protein